MLLAEARALAKVSHSALSWAEDAAAMRRRVLGEHHAHEPEDRELLDAIRSALTHR